MTVKINDDLLEPSRRKFIARSVSALSVSSLVANTSQTQTKKARVTGKTREYWLQVESYENDAAPSGKETLTNQSLGFKTKYVGLRYRAYSANWEKPLPSSDDIGADRKSVV